MIDRRQFVLSSAFVTAFASPSLGKGQNDDAVVAEIASIRAQTGVPALAGLVASTDDTLAQFAFGARRAGAPDAVTLQDPWHIGSNTKAMTAALYARMVQSGQAVWGATLPALFPDVKTDPAWSDVTIEDLMAHRAGISDRSVMVGGWLARAHADVRPLEVQRTALARQVLSAPPTGKPGAFEYANLNFILAGAAIERLSGMSWEQAIEGRLLAPLGMTSAGFGAPKGNAPWGHVLSADQTLAPINPLGLADNPRVFGPAGALHMSLADHARFARLFLQGNSTLNAESRAKLTTAAPALDPPAYGMGWMMLPERPWAKGPLLAHEGSNTFWHEIVLIAPARGLAIIAACNAGPEGSKQAARLLAKKLQATYAA